jgi:predicted MFS family arabinose efflux permease
MPEHHRHAVAAPALAIGVMFLVNGLAAGSWIARLPEVRQSLGISDAALGITLLGAGVGGTLMSFASGRIVDRVGSRPAVISTSVALSLLIPLIAVAPSAPVLFAALVAIGAVDGLTDVSQNSQALEVQGRIARSILTRMHAAWSIGALVGGLVASRAAAAGVSFTVQLVITAVVLVVTTLVASRGLLPSSSRTRQEAAADRRSIPLPRLALLFGVGVVAILAEVPPSEWSSLLMAERFDLGVGAAGLGFVAFSTGMVLGRLGGDRVVDRLGAEPARRGGSVAAAVGVVVIAVSPEPWVAGLGLVIAGLGASTLFPLTIRRASDLTTGSSMGVAAFSSGTRAGMLIGSPLMGAVSDATTRTTALLAIAGTAAVVGAAIRLPGGSDSTPDDRTFDPSAVTHPMGPLG